MQKCTYSCIRSPEMLNRTISDPFVCYLIHEVKVNSQEDIQNNNDFSIV